MTLNPYEPPQTIDVPLPVATVVHPFVRTREGLIRAAALCVEGGRIQFAAGLIGILAVLLALERDAPNADATIEKLMFLSSLVVTLVLWTWGAIKNYRGYLGMAEYATNERQASLYTWNMIQWWLQLILAVMYVFSSSPVVPRFFSLAFLLILTLSYLHSVTLQTEALRFWQARLELPSAARGYLAGGLSVVFCLGLELLLPFWGSRNNTALHVVLAVLLAVTAWDYSQRYHTVHEALLEERDQ